MTIFDDIKDLGGRPHRRPKLWCGSPPREHGTLPVPQGTPPVLKAL